jgi:hypothetical protein
MRFVLTIFCMFVCGASALAQNGVKNVRDSYGNIVRNTGMNPVRGSNQSPTNNPNGSVGSAPAQTLGPNSSTNRGTSR